VSDPERRRQIEEIFDAALDQPDAERAAWLESTCEGDPDLLAEVQALLAAHELAERIFEQEADPAEPAAERLGRYRIVREIGRGGMGVVYLGERADGQYQRRVAIKLIATTDAADPLHQRFLAERQILAGLDHPNIARLLDGDLTEDHRPYLVLEHIDGLPITTYCDRHRLGIEERLELFLDVCAAVQHAHQNLVIHRDLKPSNILVTAASEVKLLDFGIAKLLNPALSSASAPVTRLDLRVMTPEYASPEQVRGDTITTASDIYSLGVLLYELLTGSAPYHLETGSPVEVIQAVCERDPERPSTRVMHVERVLRGSDRRDEITPEQRSSARNTTVERLRGQLRGDLDSIVLMALRKEPGRRYGSADLLAQDIRRYLEGLPVTAHVGSRRYRAQKFVRRNRIEVAATAVVVVSLLSGLGSALWQARAASLERDRATGALAEAREVADFLLGMFQAGDPTELQGVEVTARELLERGMARAEALADQPLVQARMFAVVGRVYRSLGQYERADTLISRALELHRARLGPEADEVVEDLAELAQLRYLKGEYAPAESLYRAILALPQGAPPPGSAALTRTLSGLAETRMALGALAEAETLFRRALEVQRAELGDDHADMLEISSRLAGVLHLKGEYDDAEEILLRTLVRRERLHGEAHPAIAENLVQLARIAAARDDDYPRAEALVRRALAANQRVYGAEHPQVARSMMRVASGLSMQRKHEEAEPMMREAVAMHRRLLGPAHPDLASSLNSLGLLLLWTGRTEEAEHHFREALSIYRNAYGMDHQYTAMVIGNLGRVARARGQLEQAESFVREEIAIRRRTLGTEHPFVSASLINLAGVLQERGKLTEAEQLLLEAERHYLARTRTEDELRKVRTRLAELYDAWNRPSDAARARERAAALSDAP
jgi:eukaryotic-like serine/threonine-protein kinase